MSTNCIHKSVLALIAAVAISANSSRAGEGTQPRAENGQPRSFHDLVAETVKGAAGELPPRQFQNLVTDDAALETWINLGPQQPEINVEQGLPLGEFARNMVKLFSNQFDIILPKDDRDPNTIDVVLRLKDVRAIEIFNALNLYFDVQEIPAHWRLTLNGTRPTAILLIDKPKVPATPPVETEKIAPTVFSIVEILSMNSEAGDKQPLDSLADAIAAVLDDMKKPGRAKVNTPGGPILKMHAQAGILFFSGTWEDTELVRSTLAALKDAAISRSNKARELEQRAKEEAYRKAAEDAKSKATENLKK